ncbi:MAG: Gfo/Idh/MocA family oxidoreductase [Candidatus Dormiibacterota bacterium]
MVRELGVTIVGSGTIARGHVAALERIRGIRVVHVVGINASRAREVARLASGAAGTTDRRAALADPRVHAVVVCTPTDSHAALSNEAMALGKSVLVEKPAALSLAEFDGMTATAEASGVSLMVGQTSRFQAVHRELQRALVEGAIGRLRLLKLTWYVGHVWPAGWRAWQLDLARSGGHPVHNGVHPIDLAVWLLGSYPVRVFARSFRTFSPALPMPDSFHVTLRFDDGGLALVDLSYGLPSYGTDLRHALAIGEQGTIRYASEEEAGLLSNVATAPSAAIEDAIHAELVHWVATLRGEARPIVGWSEVRATLAAALGAQRSLETGRAISLGGAR